MSTAPIVGSSSLRHRKAVAQRAIVRWISDAESDVTLSPCDSWGTGAPNHTAVQNSIYYRTDASTSATLLYRNTDGAATWEALTNTGLGTANNWTALQTFTVGAAMQDSTSYFYDNADVTKKLAFQVSGVAPGTTRTITMPDSNVDLADIASHTTELAAIVAENIDSVIPISHISFVAVSGVWVRSRSATANYVITRTAGAATESLAVEVPALTLRSTASKGRKITGLKLKYSIATAAANDVTVNIGYTVVPANASAVASASTLGTITYDANHDTSAKRKAIGEHTMQVTFGTPTYLADAVGFEVLVTIDAALTTALAVSQIELLASETLVDAT